MREILKEAGDAAVLAPEDARDAVRATVARVQEAYRPPRARGSGGPPGKPSRSAPRRKRAAKVARRQASSDAGAAYSTS